MMQHPYPVIKPPAVLHLISSLQVGGSERMLVNLVDSLTETSQTAHVVVVMNNRVERNLALEIKSTSVPVHFLDRQEGSRNPKYILDLLKICTKHHVSVIHAHNRGSKYWAMLIRLARYKTKLIFTIHNTEIALSFPEVILHNAMIDSTIAISGAVATEARSLGITRVEQIENGIPIKLFRSNSPRRRRSKTRIICVGRLFLEKKGQDILIRAIKRCVDSRLDIECTLVGGPIPGDEQTLPMLHGLVSSLGITDLVRFLGDRSDVPTLLADSDIFVLPSRHEGFGLALVEAMAAGLPVIASNIEGPANILTDGMDGLLFEPESDVQLAEKISLLIESPRLADQLSANGLLTSAKYDISAMHDRYMAVYRRLMTDS